MMGIALMLALLWKSDGSNPLRTVSTWLLAKFQSGDQVQSPTTSPDQDLTTETPPTEVKPTSAPGMPHKHARYNRRRRNSGKVPIITILLLSLAVPILSVKISAKDICSISVDADSINDLVSNSNSFVSNLRNILISPENNFLVAFDDYAIVFTPFKTDFATSKINCMEKGGQVFSPMSGMELVRASEQFCLSNYSSSSLSFGIRSLSSKQFNYGLSLDLSRFMVNAKPINTDFASFTRKDDGSCIPSPLPADSDDPKFLLCKVPNNIDQNLFNRYEDAIIKAKAFLTTLTSSIEKLKALHNDTGLGLSENEDLFEEKVTPNCIQAEIKLVNKWDIDDLPSHFLSSNEAKILADLKSLGKNIMKFQKIVSQIASNDPDPLKLTHSFDTIVEALGNLSVKEPMSHFLLGTLGAIIIICIILVTLAIFCMKTAKLAMIKSLERQLI